MKTEKGFSLLEVMIALVIFGIVSASMASAFVSHLGFNYDSALRSDAIAAAQRIMEELRAQDPSTLPNNGSGATQDITVNDRIFEVTPSFCSEVTYCSANSRHISVEVVYLDQVLYVLETVYAQLK